MNHFDRWFADKGDETHRLNYPLNTNSVLVDLGTYNGKWAEKVSNRFGCNVFCFEPVKRFFNQASERLKTHPNVRIMQCGVSGESGTIDIVIPEGGDASSAFIDTPGEKETISLISMRTVLDMVPGGKIDLLKINVEGAEYDILDSIMPFQDIVGRINNLQIQFHDFVPDAAMRRNRIRDYLSATHVETYNYPFVWENWKLK